MTDEVKVLSDDERVAQIRERQGYRSEWAYGDDIEFLLNQNTALREQLAHVLICSGSPSDCEACAEAARSVKLNG